MAEYSWMNMNTSDPRVIASQMRAYNMSLGKEMTDQEAAEAVGQGQQGEQVRGRLNDWMAPLAAGQGGYNADELSQIRMTPEQQGDMVKSAGISAGANTAAAVGAAQRAAAAAGGNPMAMAAYRARAAQQMGEQAGDAMTRARVAASDAAAGRAQTIGNTRLGQQQTGLNYYSGLQNQYNQNQQAALGRKQQAYATESGANSTASQQGLTASQTPSTFDKIMGGVSGALSFLEEGDVMPAARTQAVVGENGPEKVVSTQRDYMADGGFAPPRIPSLYDRVPAPVDTTRDLGSTTTNADGSLTFTPGADSAPSPAADRPAPGGFSGLFSRIKGAYGQQQQPAGGQPAAVGAPWSPVSTYQNIGKAAGNVAARFGRFLEDGDVMPDQGQNGIFTQPTRVNLAPGEAVVPLSYRAGAKVRPSTAALPAAPITRRSYGGPRNAFAVQP